MVGDDFCYVGQSEAGRSKVEGNAFLLAGEANYVVEATDRHEGIAAQDSGACHESQHRGTGEIRFTAQRGMRHSLANWVYILARHGPDLGRKHGETWMVAHDPLGQMQGAGCPPGVVVSESDERCPGELGSDRPRPRARITAQFDDPDLG
jgi:hypothetical protein